MSLRWPDLHSKTFCKQTLSFGMLALATIERVIQCAVMIPFLWFTVLLTFLLALSVSVFVSQEQVCDLGARLSDVFLAQNKIQPMFLQSKRLAVLIALFFEDLFFTLCV